MSSSSPHRYAVLAVVLAAVLMSVLDGIVVGIALPTITDLVRHVGCRVAVDDHGVPADPHRAAPRVRKGLGKDGAAGALHHRPGGVHPVLPCLRAVARHHDADRLQGGAGGGRRHDVQHLGGHPLCRVPSPGARAGNGVSRVHGGGGQHPRAGARRVPGGHPGVAVHLLHQCPDRRGAHRGGHPAPGTVRAEASRAGHGLDRRRGAGGLPHRADTVPGGRGARGAVRGGGWRCRGLRSCGRGLHRLGEKGGASRSWTWPSSATGPSRAPPSP